MKDRIMIGDVNAGGVTPRIDLLKLDTNGFTARWTCVVGPELGGTVCVTRNIPAIADRKIGEPVFGSRSIKRCELEQKRI